MNTTFNAQAATMALAGPAAQPGGLGRSVRGQKGRAFPRRNRRGLTVGGAVFAGAIAAVFLLGLIAAYNGLVNNTRSQTTLGTISTIDTTVRRTFSNRPQFEAGTALENIAVSAVPTNAIQGTGTGRQIVTPWGGRIRVAAGNNPAATISASAPNAHNNRFFITIEALPETACETIAASFLDRADVEFVHVASGTTAFAAGNRYTDAAAIATNCDGGDDDKVAIVFRG